MTPLDNPLLAPIGERLLPSLARASQYLTGTIAFLAAILQFLAIFRASDILYPTQLRSEPGGYGVLRIRQMLGSVLAWKGWVRFPCPASSTCHLLTEKVLIGLLNHSDANVLQVVLRCWELTCVSSQRDTAVSARKMETLQRLPVVICSTSRTVSADYNAPPRLRRNPRTTSRTPAINTNKAKKGLLRCK